MKFKENQFYNALQQTPPLPETVFQQVQTQLRRRAAIIRGSYVVAIVVLVTIGFTTVSYRSAISTDIASRTPAILLAENTTDDINNELQTALDFVNGNTIEEELDQYAVVSLESY